MELAAPARSNALFVTQIFNVFNVEILKHTYKMENVCYARKLSLIASFALMPEHVLSVQVLTIMSTMVFVSYATKRFLIALSAPLLQIACNVH